VLKTREVGHCGTLDPAATGLLLVCVGGATRLVPLLTAEDKGYDATFVLGSTTDTLDAQGRVTACAPVDDATIARARACVESLKGAHALPPPAYSAVKVDGIRAHDAARRGAPLTLEPRPMEVYEVGDVTPVVFEGADGRAPAIQARLRVRKGTYIRSLAALVGERVGVPCHLGALDRTACGATRADHPGLLRPTASPPPEELREEGQGDLSGTKRKPRGWRLSVGGDRESQHTAVLAAMCAPWPLLPVESVLATGPLEVEFERLGHGQRLGPSSALGQALAPQAGGEGALAEIPKSAMRATGVSADAGRRAVVVAAEDRPELPAAIVVRIEPSGRICPDRVIRR
jgi:tRNA pseudouridine55 synthase